MSLNTIKLSPQLLADLYSNVLIESDTTVVPGTKDFRYLGRNEKNILIVNNEENAAIITDKELEFLTTIISACKLNLSDVAIVNITKTLKPYTDLKKGIDFKKAILFNVQPLDFGLPINFPHYQVQNFDGCVFLTAPSLTVIEKDKNVKKHLWNSLQKIFEL